MAVEDIIKQPMTFNIGETEDGDSDGGLDDEDDNDDCDSDYIHSDGSTADVDAVRERERAVLLRFFPIDVHISQT